jgi:mono/diheme cytochrome c family protein
VTLAGVQQVATVDVGRLHALLAGEYDLSQLKPTEAYTGSASNVWQLVKADPVERRILAHHLGAMYGAGLLSRTDIPTRCPRGIGVAPDGGLLAVGGYHSGELLLLDPATCAVVRRVALGEQPTPDLERQGEIAFHDARRCFQHWLSCATCHPDGRADGLNWDLLNDGIGNPKNTRSLVLSDDTPPVMSRAVRKTYEVAVQKGFQFIQFYEASPDEVEAVKAYVRSLKPEASPLLVRQRNGLLTLSEKARRGKRVFEDGSTACAVCHSGPLFTDLKLYDVGTRHGLDRGGEFDNPTLCELWRTAPYLHDGSAATMLDVLTALNAGDEHGVTSHLSEQDLADLAEYLLSL